MTDQTVTKQTGEPTGDATGTTDAAPDRPQSAYLAARQEWDDRFAGQRKTVRVLTGITFLALVLGILGMGYGVYTGARTQFLPYLVKVDELGRVEPGPPPQRVDDWPPQVIRRELDLFFERLRSISRDHKVIGDNHRAVEKFIPSGSPAATKLRSYHQDPRNNPLTRAETETVAVEVISVNSVSSSTWRVEWRETLFSRTSGKQTGLRRFVATVQISFRTPGSRALLKINPLGLFVEDFDIQEIRI